MIIFVASDPVIFTRRIVLVEPATAFIAFIIARPCKPLTDAFIHYPRAGASLALLPCLKLVASDPVFAPPEVPVEPAAGGDLLLFVASISILIT